MQNPTKILLKFFILIYFFIIFLSSVIFLLNLYSDYFNKLVYIINNIIFVMYKYNKFIVGSQGEF